MMKMNFRCTIAFAAALTCCGLLASCGNAAPESTGAPVSSTPASPESSAPASSTADAEKEPSAAESEAPAAESEASAQPITPANFNESWSGQIKTRKILYYDEGKLVDDKLAETYEYDENGRVTKVTIGDGNEYYQYQYDDHGNLVLFEDILGGQVTLDKPFTYEYYDNGQISSKTAYASYSDEPKKERTIFYDTQGREIESISYDYMGRGESAHYRFRYDDSKPHECVIDRDHTEYETDGSVKETRSYTSYGYTLPDPKGEYRFDEFDLYAMHDITTEANFYKYYETLNQGVPNYTYDEHGSVTDDGVSYKYAYEYNSNGMLLKMTCNSTNGDLVYEYEFDGNGHITRNKSYNSGYKPESLALRVPYDEVRYEYEFY